MSEPTLQGAIGPALRKTKASAAAPSPPTTPFEVVHDAATSTTSITFHTRRANSKDANAIGTLAEHFTMVRRPHNKLCTINVRHLFLNYNMFKYAQLSMQRYNATVAPTPTPTPTPTTLPLNATDPTEINVFYERRNWQELMSSIGERVTENEVQNLLGLDALLETLATLKEEQILESTQNAASGQVFFEDLQFVYPSGSKVLCNHIAGPNMPTGLTVLWTQYTEGKTMYGSAMNFTMYLECWITVGHHFVPIRFQDISFQYRNKKTTSSLYFVPMATDDSGTRTTMDTLVARADVYVRQAVGHHFVTYGEQSFYPKSAKQTGSSSAASRGGGRILIDTVTAAEQFCIARGAAGGCWNDFIALAHRHYKNYLRDASNGTKNARGEEKTERTVQATGEGHEATTETTTKRVLTQYPSMFYEDVPVAARFSCWPVVAGFSFTAKLWGVVLVDSLREIQYNGDAFEKLVLPASRKRLIRAVVQYGSENMSDIIRGKGEGVVFLFYGPPGVGKTLTAEAVAEMLQRPLYQVSMGELGVTPGDLEKGLKNVLTMCAQWNALVLLDEADIFVERRSESSGILRNAMVSVMLRMIEYFQGVLFLTTNRVETFDPAFQTRITAAIKYEPLGTEAREEVWTNLITASGHAQSLLAQGGDVDPSILATYSMNGRSIKNALRLALSLAMAEAVEKGDKCATAVLRHTSLLETVEMCVQFNDDMNVSLR